MDADPMEQPAADSAPAEPPDTGPGVPTPPQPPTATVAEAASTHETAEPTAGGAPPRHALKLVVSLRPGNSMGYRALIALGSDGCDPLLHAADVADLAGALEEVPGLLAEAEGRWQLQPRYPAAAPAKTRPPGGSRAPTPRQGPSRREAPATPAEPRRTPAPSPLRTPASPQSPAPPSSQADQLTLFG
jgi:hypothetical protein